MREILFIGDLSNYGDCKTIATTKGFSIVDNSEVISETVGQYTGLTDTTIRNC